MKVVYLWE